MNHEDLISIWYQSRYENREYFMIQWELRSRFFPTSRRFDITYFENNRAITKIFDAYMLEEVCCILEEYGFHIPVLIPIPTPKK